MANRNFWLKILAIGLVLGMTVVGCDNDSTGGGSDTWTDVTSLSQLNGTWKANPSSIFRFGGSTELATGGEADGLFTSTIGYESTSDETTIPINVSEGKMAFISTGSLVFTFTGTDMGAAWTYIKNNIAGILDENRYTVHSNSFNDANYSVKVTSTQEMNITTLSDISSQFGKMQINKTGTLIKLPDALEFYGVEVTLAKQ